MYCAKQLKQYYKYRTVNESVCVRNVLSSYKTIVCVKSMHYLRDREAA